MGFNKATKGFAEIFFGNSTNLGIICVTAGDLERETLAKAIEADPQLQVTIDIDAGEIRYGEHRLECAIKANARESLMSGNYDPLDELLSGANAVEEVAHSLPYMRRV